VDMALKSALWLTPTCAHAGRQKSRGNVNSASLIPTEDGRQDILMESVASGATFRKQREQALLAKFKIWAWSFDGDREHSRNVARIALQLHDGFVKKRILRFAHANSRGLLHAAALAHGWAGVKPENRTRRFQDA